MAPPAARRSVNWVRVHPPSHPAPPPGALGYPPPPRLSCSFYCKAWAHTDREFACNRKECLGCGEHHGCLRPPPPPWPPSTPTPPLVPPSPSPSPPPLVSPPCSPPLLSPALPDPKTPPPNVPPSMPPPRVPSPMTKSPPPPPDPARPPPSPPELPEWATLAGSQLLGRQDTFARVGIVAIAFSLCLRMLCTLAYRKPPEVRL